MRVSDYLRFSSAHIFAHKKQASLIILISSLPFILLTTLILLIQGLESSLLSATLAPTNGKVLLTTSIDPDYCPAESYRPPVELQHIRENIIAHGGQILDAHLVTNEFGTFLQIPYDPNPDQILPEHAIPIAVPIETAAQLLNLDLPAFLANPDTKLATVTTIQKSALHQAITTNQNQSYYLTALLPSDYFIHNLSFANLDQDNPLNLLLASLHTAGSTNLMFTNADTPNVSDINLAETNTILAAFPDLTSATSYVSVDSNFCSENDRFLKSCPEPYRYQVSQVIGSPIDLQRSFQQIWSTLTILIFIISIIEIIVIISTYLRLIDKDAQNISLYYAMGARKTQVIRLYLIYLLILSLLTIFLSTFISLTLSGIISIANANSLSQIFTLGFATTANPLNLIGWNQLILLIDFLILAPAPLSILLSVRSL